jgi:peptidoglycan hydrolase CwlO-like protein
MSTTETALRRAQAPYQPPRIVSDADVDKALHFLRDSARTLGDLARQKSEKASLVKRTKALLMKEHSDKSLGAAEREALCDERYAKVETEEAIACGEYECLRALRDAAMAEIDCWRSETATLRAVRL